MNETNTKEPNWLEFETEKLNSEFETIKILLQDHKFIDIRSKEDLVELKKFIYSQLPSGYFKSERHKLAFMLSKYERSAFNKELGITRRHFVDKSLAKSWMGKMQAMFNPDRNKDITNDIDFDEITAGINKAYGEMVGRQ